MKKEIKHPVLKSILAQTGNSMAGLAKKIGKVPQIFYDINDGTIKNISFEVATLINREYPEFNIDWMRTGDGEMLKVNPELYKDEQNRIIRAKQEERIERKPSPKGIPLIPIDAMAGFGNGENQIIDYDLSVYDIPEFTELKADFMIRIKGSSMYPKYSSGDLVACKKLPLSDMFFQWNKVYVLDTEQGALIKRIKKGKDKNHVLIVSENERYESFELAISKINAVALVLGVIRLE